MILSRLKPIAETVLGHYQCGFRPGRSVDQIFFGVRQAMEKMWETDQQMFQLFIDFRQAYDSLNRHPHDDSLNFFFDVSCCVRVLILMLSACKQ